MSWLGRPHRALLAVALVVFFAGIRETSADEAQKREELQRAALATAGDPVRGKELFRDERRTKCAICHQVNGEGGNAGPQLSAIGGKFDRPHLIESLLEPSRQIVEGYRTSIIEVTNGQVLTGIVREETDTDLVLFDAKGERRKLSLSEITERKTDSQSLMPSGLADVLSSAEFTDLIAYLETLRSGVASPGSGTSGPILVPKGFVVRTVATSMTGGVAIEATSDGRVLLCEQIGALRVIRDGKLLDAPMLKLNVNTEWERGLIGVTVDPGFSKAPYVYVCYVAASPYPHHIVSRWTVKGDVAIDGSEVVLWKGDDQRMLGGNVPAGHQGGAIHFGLDGKLYIAIGDQTAGAPSQRMDTFQGKLLRINPDGTIPDDNPFVKTADGKYRAIWALGLRNPFTFAVQPGTGLLYINDVGGDFEEINIGRSGANYGWPTVEHGRRNDARFVDPIHQYKQASISGSDFVPKNSNWPNEWRGKYLFADFVHGWIHSLDPDNPENVTTFAEGLRRPVDLRFGSEGQLYVLLRNAWVIDDKFQTGTSSLLEIRPENKSAK